MNKRCSRNGGAASICNICRIRCQHERLRTRVLHKLLAGGSPVEAAAQKLHTREQSPAAVARVLSMPEALLVCLFTCCRVLQPSCSSRAKGWRQKQEEATAQVQVLSMLSEHTALHDAAC
jgi:hypothetical protein